MKAIAATLAAHRIAGVIVMRDGMPAGVVSESDLVQVEAEAEDESVRGRRFRQGRRRRRPPSRTAGDLLHGPLLAIEPQASAVAAAWVMGRNDVGRLAVIDHGSLVGIVTRADLIRALARSDEQVRRDIVDDVFPALDVSANDVTVTVEDGIVRLGGVVEDAAEARCLPHAVRSVLGVVDVVSEVSARHEHRRFDRESAAV